MKKVDSHYQAKVIPPDLTPEQEEDFYFRDPNPHYVVVDVEHLQKDVICSLCGLWKSEHRWEVCSNPNWL